MIEKVRQLIQSNRRMTIVELEQEIGISRIHSCNSVRQFEDETWFLHTIMLLVQQFLAEKNIPVVNRHLLLISP
jgi:hypothetical protein